MTMLDAAAAADQVLADMPVLFIDTCSLLDIPRIVEHARKPHVEISAAQRVLAAARAQPGKVALFVAEVVVAEWNANKPAVIE